MLLAHLTALKTILSGLATVQAWLGVVPADPDVPEDDAAAAALALLLFRAAWPAAQDWDGQASNFIVLGTGLVPWTWTADSMAAGLAAGLQAKSARISFVHVLASNEPYGETSATAFLSAIEGMLAELLTQRGNTPQTNWVSLQADNTALPLPSDPADADYYPARLQAGELRAYQLTFELSYRQGN